MMITRNLLFNILASAFVYTLLVGVGRASVPRSFVSINGSDTNPCSAVQPCRSFTQALAVVQAGGEVVVQDSGGYSTGFTISQSVTIDAAGFNASVISTSGTDLCTISAGSSDKVVLRGISFHGAGVGHWAINVAQVGSLYVEHCSISEFISGVVMENGGNLFVTGTDVRKCTGIGIDVGTNGATAANVVAHDSRCTECFYGFALGSGGTGNVTGWLDNCAASLGGAVGFYAESASAGNVDLTLTNCRAAGNGDTGIFARTDSTGNTTVRLVSCVVTRNIRGINAFGPLAKILGTSPGSNLISDNISTDGTISGTRALQ